MTITIDRQTDVYSRPNARFNGDGTLEIRASAVGNCRRALWLRSHGPPGHQSPQRRLPHHAGGGQRPGAGGAAGHAAGRVGHHAHR